MLKNLLAASCATVLMVGAASAADLPRRAAPPVFTPVPVFTWTGFYAGINAGYAFGGDRRNQTTLTDTSGLITQDILDAVGDGRRDQGGFTGGGQIGYNYQFTPGSGVVVGIEADAAYTDLQRRRTSSGDIVDPNNALTINVDSTTRSDLSFLGTVRGRIGYAFDRALFYGTGGFAYGQSEFGQTINIGNTIGGISSGPTEAITGGFANRFQTGYAYGGGIEYALPTDSFFNFFRASAVTFKVEYLHYDLGSRNVVGFYDIIPASGISTPVTLTRVRTEGDIVRAGVNYKFGSY